MSDNNAAKDQWREQRSEMQANGLTILPFEEWLEQQERMNELFDDFIAWGEE